tara:strand:+ start:11228 stop:12070 length:843 start_codon:yes stop_codon:yes gene_type:complete
LNKFEKKIPFTLIAGPCVIENKELTFEIAKSIKEICKALNIRFIFKSSFDKANRSSGKSFRGLGLNEGLNILYNIKDKLELEILTDIHEPIQAKEVAKVVDVIQIPAFLCRQTNLLNAAADSIVGTQKIINVKKGQFLAPWDMNQVINKLRERDLDLNNNQIWITERGTSFGYNTLIVDFRSLPQLKSLGCPVIFDATHSVQQPGGRGTSSGGQREFVAPLSKAAVAVGVDGLFMEVHPDPDKALSDGPNMVPLKRLKKILEILIKIDKITKESQAPSTY